MISVVGLLYVAYYFILFGALISEIVTPQTQHANIATIAVTASHFVVGSLEALSSSMPLLEFVRTRYIKSYNIAADIIITAALVLATVALFQSHPALWITFTPVSLAIVGNTGCLYGRVSKQQKEDTAFIML